MHLKYQQISIMIADDHEIFRDGFKSLLSKYPEIELVAEAENGRELLQLSETYKPDVILTDIKMPVMDGIEATKELIRKNPDSKIIALSMFDENNLIVDMLEAGAKGYLLKNANKTEIIEAIEHVYGGETYYCKQTSGKLIKMISKSRFNPYRKTKPVHFTPREIQVMQLICEECANKEIAAKLDLSVRTIESYRDKILEKINAKNTVGVVIYAIKNGIYKI